MTSRDSLQGKPPAPQNSVALNRCYRICGTGGCEPARRREEGREQGLIRPYWQDRDASGHSHSSTPASTRSRWSSAVRAAGLAAPVIRRAITTTSHPVQGAPSSRAACRITRLLRLRPTAEPRRLPAINATRPRGPRPSGVLFARTTSDLPLALRAVRNIVSISREDLIVPFTAPSRGSALRSQYLTALAAPVRNYSSAAACRHARTETMRLAALSGVGLERPLHVLPPS